MADMHELAPQQRIALLYEAMASATSAMLAAARAEDWDVLVTLEAACAAHVATLQQGEPLAVLSAQQRERKGALVKQMLADDVELRRLIAARMAQLSNEMSSANTERKLSRAYGA
jgi:flagellar protein FliT